MNANTGKLMMLITVILIFGLFSLEQPTSAQSPQPPQSRVWFERRGNAAQSASPNSNCKKLKGRSVQVFDPATGVVSGPVTNAGILNGTFEDVINFDAGFVLTPDPNVVTFTSDMTITTSRGQLKATPVITQSMVTGAGTEFGNINPATSTGKFAGATGMIFMTFKLVGNDPNGPYEAEISGEICFANE